MDNTTFQTASYTVPKVETTIIPLDPERLEIVKKILEQNQMILDFVLYSPPSNLFLNVNGSDFKFNNGMDVLKEELAKVMR